MFYYFCSYNFPFEVCIPETFEKNFEQHLLSLQDFLNVIRDKLHE